MKKYRLDKEEQEILDAIERGEWERVRPKKAELERYAKIAKDTLRKNQRMNIRISKSDLDRIKAKAAEEASPIKHSLPAFSISTFQAICKPLRDVPQTRVPRTRGRREACALD